MTVKHAYKIAIGVLVLLAHAFIANAQNEEKWNTGESRGKQFLNNKVPGMQYAPAKPKAQRRATAAEQQENHDESSGMQLKKGTLKGMQYAGGGNSFKGTRTAKPARLSTTAGQSLPSDVKPAVSEKPAAVTAPVLPLQEGQQPAEVAKPAPVKQPVKKLTAKQPVKKD